MKLPENKRMYFFVDESGDPNFYGRRKKDLIELGLASKYFIVGYVETENMNQITKQLTKIKSEIVNDEYLKEIPSIKHSIKRFHANKDCREVQERVFRAIKAMDIEAYIIIARKDIKQFSQRFRGCRGDYYAYLVERLFENRLHLYSNIDIYFSKMQNVIHEKNMWGAIEKAIARFGKKWKHKNTNIIRPFMQEPTQIAGLQVVDYILWTIHRVYNHSDMRYFHFLRDKIKLVHDIFINNNNYGEYFTSKNELTLEKIGIKK